MCRNWATAVEIFPIKDKTEIIYTESVGLYGVAHEVTANMGWRFPLYLPNRVYGFQLEKPICQHTCKMVSISLDFIANVTSLHPVLCFVFTSPFSGFVPGL